MTDTLPPDYPLYQYKLIVPLNEGLQQTIENIRASFYGRYKIAIPLLPSPSLPILQGAAYESIEENLVERLQQVAARTQAFEVQLKNFSSTPSNTICIPPANTTSFENLEKELRIVKSLFSSVGEAQLTAMPTVLLAAGLKPFQFIRMWMDCEHQPFTAHCTATEMVLQKATLNSSAYEVVQRFAFSPAVQEIKQSAMFT